jgi:large subunit ribosomal protein L32
MAVPKKKTSPSKRNMRRAANSKVSSVNVVENKVTGEMHRPHMMTKNGYYNGKQVIIPKEKKNKEVEEQE